MAFVLMVLGTAMTFGQQARGTVADAIVTLERGALDRWGRGDPSGYLELYSSDATYFDPMQEKRVDGLGALKEVLEPIKGKVKVDRYEMIAPRVDRAGDLAVFTYNLVSHGRRPDGRATETRWNVTAVYRREDGRWRIAHHHFSFTRPELKVFAVPVALRESPGIEHGASGVAGPDRHRGADVARRAANAELASAETEILVVTRAPHVSGLQAGVRGSRQYRSR
jgi:uncharacterized protein (TIGR02246 family)